MIFPYVPHSQRSVTSLLYPIRIHSLSPKDAKVAGFLPIDWDHDGAMDLIIGAWGLSHLKYFQAGWCFLDEPAIHMQFTKPAYICIHNEVYTTYRYNRPPNHQKDMCKESFQRGAGFKCDEKRNLSENKLYLLAHVDFARAFRHRFSYMLRQGEVQTPCNSKGICDKTYGQCSLKRRESGISTRAHCHIADVGMYETKHSRNPICLLALKSPRFMHARA